MEILKHPSRFIWTFGNHEPLSMYRRIGRNSTGGMPGGALWLEKWHRWYDSEECARTMAGLGMNLLLCRCYKGLGWGYEKADFPNVVSFARNCRKHGIKVLAYIQYSTLYPEIMRREIPDLINWASLNRDGKPYTYFDSYWRWMPCPNRPGFIDYLDGVLHRIAGSGEFDGVMFDNTISFPCYCPDCRKKFAAGLAADHFDFLDPDFVEMPPEHLPEEIMEPVAQAFLRFRYRTVQKTFEHFRKVVKSIDPECLISANVPIMPRWQGLAYFNTPPLALSPSLDITLSQTGNQPEWNGQDCVISQTYELKMMKAMHINAVPLNDADAGGDGDAGSSYIGPLFESLFGGSIPVDRIIMKPLRGGALNKVLMEARKPILDRLREIARKYEPLLELPDYAPVGLLYAEDALLFSKSSSDDFLRCQESLLRGHIPYRLIPSRRDWIDEAALSGCSTVIVPGARCLSDRIVSVLRSCRGHLVLAGDGNGDYDENYRQRETSPFDDLPDAEKVPVTPHDVSNAEWRTEIHFVADDWGERFAAPVRLRLHPAASVVFKQNEKGKIAGILISAPLRVEQAGEVTLPESMRAASYEFVTLAETCAAEFEGDKLKLPPFDGMLMIRAR